jgi:hypothetical protein
MAARCTIVSVLTEEQAAAGPAVRAASVAMAAHQGLLLVVSPPRRETGTVHAESGSWCAGSHLPAQRFHVKQSHGSLLLSPRWYGGGVERCLEQRSRRSYSEYLVYSELAHGNGKHQLSVYVHPDSWRTAKRMISQDVARLEAWARLIGATWNEWVCRIRSSSCFLLFAGRAAPRVVLNGGMPLRSKNADCLDGHRPRVLWQRVSKAVCGIPNVGVSWNAPGTGFSRLLPTLVEGRYSRHPRRNRLSNVGEELVWCCVAMFTLA